MRAVQALFLCFGALSAALPAFLSVAMAARGFTPLEIGLALGAASIASMVAIPVWGHVGDVVLGRARALRLALVVASVFILLYGLPLPIALIGLAVVALTFAQSSFSPLADSLAVNVARGDYGRVRLLSSLSFAVVVSILGLVYQQTGYGPAPFVYVACALGMLVTTLRIPDVPRARLDALGHAQGLGGEAERQPHRRTGFGSFGAALRVEPRLRPVLLACALAGIGIIVQISYFSLRLVELGGGPAEVAVAGAIQAAAEIPAMLGSAWLARRFGLRLMFAAGCLIYAACLLVWATASSREIFILSRGVSGIGFGIVWVSVALTMAVLLPPRLQATGQALFQTVGLGLAAALANTLGGLLYQTVGVGAVFGIPAILALVACVAGLAWFPARGARMRAQEGP